MGEAPLRQRRSLSRGGETRILQAKSSPWRRTVQQVSAETDWEALASIPLSNLKKKYPNGSASVP